VPGLGDKTSQDPSFVQRLNALQERLKEVGYLESLTDAVHSEPDAVALGLLDIQKAAREIDEAISEVVKEGKDDERLHDLLIDIGESHREIAWHMKDMRFFSYLFDKDGKLLDLHDDNDGE
jgi:hypothetical protein